MSKYKGEIGLLIVTLIWGFGFPITNITLRYMSASMAVVLRFTIAAALLSFIFWKSFKKMDKSVIIGGAVVGFCLYFATMTQTWALGMTSPSKCAFITTTNVVIVPIIGLLFFRQKMLKYSVMGAILAVVGTAVLSLQGDLSIELGDALSLVCAVGYACHVFFTGHYINKGNDPIRLAVVQMITGAVLAVVTMSFFGFESLADIPLEGWLAMGFMGVISTTGSFLLQTVSQGHVTNQTRAVVILSMESVFGTLASILLLSDPVTPRMVLGMAIILGGVLLSETGPAVFEKKKMA